MKYKILYKSYSTLQVVLEEGEKFIFNGVSLLGMDKYIRIGKGFNTSFKEGIIGLLNGELPFWQYLTAEGKTGSFLLSGGKPGVITDLTLSGNTGIKVIKSAFLGCTEEVNVLTKFEPLTKKYLKNNKKLYSLTGKGTVFLSNFGEIHQIDIKDGEEYLVDLSCLVAFPDFMEYSIEKSKNGWMNVFSKKATILARFYGPGSILVQTCGDNCYRLWTNDLGFVLEDDMYRTLNKGLNKTSRRLYECIDRLECRLSSLENESSNTKRQLEVIESNRMMENVYDRRYSNSPEYVQERELNTGYKVAGVTSSRGPSGPNVS